MATELTLTIDLRRHSATVSVSAAAAQDVARRVDGCIALRAELDRITAERDGLRALLKRYRDEVPLGHQPHMLAHEVDAALKDSTA